MMDLPNSRLVGRSGVSFIHFLIISGSKNDPKITKNLGEKIKNFCRKILGKYFDLLSKIISFRFWSKMADFTRFWKNFLKIYQNGKFGSVMPIK